jgi:hypothetical protein
MEALAAFPFWEDDSEDIYLETGSGSSMEESPQEGFCLDKDAPVCSLRSDIRSGVRFR